MAKPKPVKYLGYTSPKKLISKVGKPKGKGKPKKTKPVKTKAPVTPTPAPVDPILQQAKANAQLQYGNQILREQGALSNAGTWFDQYKADARAAAATVPATYNAAATAGSQAPTVGPAVMTPEGQQAAASRGIMDQNWKNYAGAQGAAQSAYFTGRAVVGSAQQLASRQSSQAKIAALAADKDAYQITQYGKLQEAAHTQQLQDALFQNTTDKTAADIAAKRAAAATARKNARTNRLRLRADLQKSQETINAKGETVNAHGYTAKAWAALGTEKRREIIAADKKTGGAKAGGLTATQRASQKAKRNKTWSDIHTTAGSMQAIGETKYPILDDNGNPTGKTRKATRAETFAQLRKEHHSQDEILVALAVMRKYKEWDARTRAAAKRLGIKVPKQHQPSGGGKVGAVRPLQVPGGRY